MTVIKLTFVQVEAALASDAARLITDAVESAPNEIEIEAKPIECGSEDQWEIGDEFLNHILTVSNTGVIKYLKKT